MNFNPHYELKEEHAFLSPSNYHWVNYTDDKMQTVYINLMMAKRGTELHALAHSHIKLGIKMPRTKKTLDQYVNDAIGYKMVSEQKLKYSDLCFGTADAISFSESQRILRIHDLKTGVTPASMTQLRIYAALFCLEYDYSPNDLNAIILRIYQNDEVFEEVADPKDILYLMDKIKHFDVFISEMNKEGW